MAGPKRVLPSTIDEASDDDESQYSSIEEDGLDPDTKDDDLMEDESGESEGEEEGGSGDESAGDSVRDTPSGMRLGVSTDWLQEPDAIDTISTISFGTLAEAQASLPPSKRRRISTEAPPKPSIEDVKAKLSEMRGLKPSNRKKESEPKPKRASKNAPTEMTSKKPVSRKREIVPLPAVKARDPRFDPAMGDFEEGRFKKNYAFLSDYRNSELEDLKVQFKKEKDEDRRADLKHKIKSMVWTDLSCPGD